MPPNSISLPSHSRQKHLPHLFFTHFYAQLHKIDTTFPKLVPPLALCSTVICFLPPACMHISKRQHWETPLLIPTWRLLDVLCDIFVTLWDVVNMTDCKGTNAVFRNKKKKLLAIADKNDGTKMTIVHWKLWLIYSEPFFSHYGILHLMSFAFLSGI